MAHRGQQRNAFTVSGKSVEEVKRGNKHELLNFSSRGCLVLWVLRTKSQSDMFRLETFESQLSSVMETLVEAAVTELGRLLERSSAPVVAAQQRSAASVVAVKREDEEREVTLRRQLLHEDVTVTPRSRAHGKCVRFHWWQEIYFPLVPLTLLSLSVRCPKMYTV